MHLLITREHVTEQFSEIKVAKLSKSTILWALEDPTRPLE